MPDNKIWTTIVCLSIVLSSKNDYSWKKWLLLFATQAITQTFFLKKTVLLQKAEVLYAHFLFHHSKCEKDVCSKVSLTKLQVYFSASTFLSENFSLIWVCGAVKNVMTSEECNGFGLWCHFYHYTKASAVLPTIAFAPLVQQSTKYQR